MGVSAAAVSHRVAKGSRHDLYADLAGLGRCDGHSYDVQGLACLPGDGCLALDW